MSKARLRMVTFLNTDGNSLSSRELLLKERRNGSVEIDMELCPVKAGAILAQERKRLRGAGCQE